MNQTHNGFPQNHDLANKTVVITGASSGVGRAAAIAFAKHKCKIVLAARDMKALDEVEAECREMGAVAIAVATDVTDAQAVKNLAITAQQFGGAIDVWINNAGVLAAGEFTETPIEVHDHVIRTNLMGYLHGAHAVLPYFKQQQYGLLINNISVGGWMPVPYGVGYSASKFGLRGFSEALRGELIKYPNIHMCDLFPAFLDTPGIQHAANYTGKILKPAPPVYDPQRVAKTMVEVALNPKKSVSVGAVAPLMRMAHFLLPGVTRYLTAKVVEAYLQTARPAPHTSGNVFAPVDYGTSIHGGWDTFAKPNKKTTVAILIGAVAAGLLIRANKKQHNKKEAMQPDSLVM